MKTLYQKYRPKVFSEIVGQEFIVKVLKNSIKYDQIQNAYIFHGSRGTGKTSIAKIFSKAINCSDKENPLLDKCAICNYFSDNKEYEDIFELDAASNNGVDDIRKVIENAYFQPVKLKRKVYIIDEVHMLSKGAFNALLKTLEEPPENVVFILATTEIKKIPTTILSRCQRFDFNRIKSNDMVNTFSTILEKENYKYDEEALRMIDGFSDGCLRDGLSLLQKVIIGEKEVTKKIVSEKLNVIDEDYLEKLYYYMMNNDTEKLLKLWEDIYYQGINENLFILDIQKYFKNKLLENNDILEKNKIMKIIYKVNDVEQRATYSSNLNNLIQVLFIDITQDTKQIVNENNVEKTNKEKISDNKKLKEKNINLKTNQKKEELNLKNDVEKSNKKTATVNFTMDNYFDILKKATKEHRIEYTKKFTIISQKLNQEKVHGLAKFFGESNIRAASNEGLIVTIQNSLIEPYYARYDNLKSHLEDIDLIIMNDENWFDVREKFIKNKSFSSTSTKNDNNEFEQEFKEHIEKKMNINIKMMEE